ncbi:MAG TPA: hypothetical protein VH025_08765 [Solirubrobacteraceae bacterium]|nr:hypothetical protein [Solirubrobacteraceae bacterium]
MRTRLILRALLAAALGVAVALLVSCGSSGKGLIPTANAGPLRGDFETVKETAEDGDGDCTTTEAAVLKTEEDFGSLPTSINAELDNRLRQGIQNLRKQSLELCRQPLTKTTATDTQTTSTSTTPPPETTETATTPPPVEEEPEEEAEGTPGAPGGTAAPGEEGVETEGSGVEGAQEAPK